MNRSRPSRRRCRWWAAGLLAVLAAGCGPGRGPAEPASGRLHRLPAWGWGTPALSLRVPEGYERGLRAGEGFMVHLFRPPPEAAPPERATLAIYVGRHPREPRSMAVSEAGTVAGREVTWFGDIWEDDRGRTIYHAETYVRGLFRWPVSWRLEAQGLVVHVMAWGTDQAEVERLMEAAVSLRLAP